MSKTSLEILVNGERTGRIWKKARSIEIRDPENPEASIGYISLSRYHLNQFQIYVNALGETRVDLELNQFHQEEINMRPVGHKFWSFDPYGGNYSRPGGKAKHLENLTKARDYLNELIEKVEAQDPSLTEVKPDPVAQMFPDEGETRKFMVHDKLYFWTRDELEYEMGVLGQEADKLWENFIPETDETPESQDKPEPISKKVLASLNGDRALEVLNQVAEEEAISEEPMEWKCPHCHSLVPETTYCLNCGKDMGGINGYE